MWTLNPQTRKENRKKSPCRPIPCCCFSTLCRFNTDLNILVLFLLFPAGLWYVSGRQNSLWRRPDSGGQRGNVPRPQSHYGFIQRLFQGHVHRWVRVLLLNTAYFECIRRQSAEMLRNVWRLLVARSKWSKNCVECGTTDTSQRLTEA